MFWRDRVARGTNGGATTTPHWVPSANTLEKRLLRPYSHAGFSDFFLTNKVATKLPTRKKVGGRSVYICAIISVLKRKESNDAKATY